MKILVIGASGFFGTRIIDMISEKHEIIGTYSKNKKSELYFLDATNYLEVKKFILEHKPDVIIDNVVLVSSVECEKNPWLAKKLNYETAKNILEAAKLIDATMVFMSSTYIFDGKKGNYSEDEIPIPINEYGKTKIMAENELIKYKNSIIIRVDIMYGYNGKYEKNGVFGSSILSNKEIKLRTPNQLRKPVFVDDVVKAILFLLEENQKGIFHVAGKDEVNMIDFLKGMEKIVRNKSIVFEDMDKTKKSSVKIPFNATLNISKMENIGFETHSFLEGLNLLEKQYKEKKD